MARRLLARATHDLSRDGRGAGLVRAEQPRDVIDGERLPGEQRGDERREELCLGLTVDFGQDLEQARGVAALAQALDHAFLSIEPGELGLHEDIIGLE